mmetsp:Transcript_23960/g.57821  ORF Transcript_23960/g.57821 Transcript_23960/m.57821 type:complete len:94 (+) Transcript_23960:204-485(+)
MTTEPPAPLAALSDDLNTTSLPYSPASGSSHSKKSNKSSVSRRQHMPPPCICKIHGSGAKNSSSCRMTSLCPCSLADRDEGKDTRGCLLEILT